VELSEAGDAVRFGLQQEALTDKPIGALHLAPALRSIRTAVDKADTKHAAGALERLGNIGAAVIRVQDFGSTPPLDGRAQHLLAGARVLLGHPRAVNEQP